MDSFELEPGKKYTGVVDRLSESGNAIISLDSGHVNLGKLTPAADGKKVDFVYLEGSFGRCTTTEYTPEPYDWKLPSEHVDRPLYNISKKELDERGPTSSQKAEKDTSDSPISKNPHTPNDNKNDLLGGHK